MKNYLNPSFSISGELRNISVLGLAHVGDAVYELMVRTRLCSQGAETAKRMHDETVTFVSAKAQAAASNNIMPMLNDEEKSVFKRGRNAHINAFPRASTYEEYHTATGIEALFGFLYLTGQVDRLNELFEAMVE